MSFYNVEMDGSVAIMRLERPPVNALAKQVYIDLMDTLKTLEDDDNVRVVIMTGSPKVKAMIGGADLNEFMELDYDSRLKRFETVDEAFDKLEKFTKPLLGVANGPTVGAGVAMLSLCDIRLASDTATFLIPEIDRGVMAAHLPMMKKLGVPSGIIKEWIFTCRRFNVYEAHYHKFIDYVYPPDDLLPNALRLAQKIAAKSKDALRFQKLYFIESEQLSWSDAYKKSHEYSAILTSGTNSKEGISAFLHKRIPNYKESDGAIKKATDVI
ncbi:2,3-dehydroadipyl-CoA hydratase [Synergistales bacterium]|nr:2,3-dehydroadipyl-CoA hydratase [Synergistales bacterium]